MEGEGMHHSYDDELKSIQTQLNKYRGFILPLHKVLEWEPSYYPAVVIGILTFVFALVWYIEPSVITTFSVIGILVCLTEFAAPVVSNKFFKQPDNWTELEEIHFERSCTRFLNAKKHVTDGWNRLLKLKTEKPNVYLVVVCGVLITLAWIGSLIDSLLLAYLIVAISTLVPGLRKHGILQKVTDLLKSKIPKTKTN
jgi:hypothetical protein